MKTRLAPNPERDTGDNVTEMCRSESQAAIEANALESSYTPLLKIAVRNR